MANEEAVKKDGTAAAAEEVKTNEQTASPVQDELTENERFLLGALDKSEQDKENYKKGLLKAKGKLPDEGNEPSDEEKLRLIVQEELAKAQSSQDTAKAKKLAEELIKENKELKVALKNRGGLAIPQGGGSDKAQPEAGVGLSPEQIAELKKRNPKLWTDERIASLAPKLANKK